MSWLPSLWFWLSSITSKYKTNSSGWAWRALATEPQMSCLSPTLNTICQMEDLPLDYLTSLFYRLWTNVIWKLSNQRLENALEMLNLWCSSGLEERKSYASRQIERVSVTVQCVPPRFHINKFFRIGNRFSFCFLFYSVRLVWPPSPSVKSRQKSPRALT